MFLAESECLVYGCNGCGLVAVQKAANQSREVLALILRLSQTVLSVFFVLMVTAAPQAHAVERSLEKVRGNVYKFVNDRHRSMVMVGPDSVLVTDPINTEAATWLKAEIKKRFNLPIHYVVYSHNHADHVYGGEVFQSDHTTFVSHELAKQDLVLTRARTVIPSVTFDQTLTLNLGDQRVELRYHGPNDGRGSISMLFLPEKVLHVVDWVLVGRMPWKGLWSYDIAGVINSTKEVLDLDFEVFVGGHADQSDRAGVERYFKYLNSLYAAVIDGIHAGQSLEQLKASIRLDEFSDLKHYEDWLPMNIEGVHERLMEESGMGWRPMP
ncbi:MAG: MBL fold metallo-hydrolase [Limnobacter sp.]|nr:MBL fold metallo-hydrolase [Limnobacter sp.]